ncbi:MAG: SEL1-like repeat protein [Alphaproteobacteria bacterium]|nr:SEL1-like repeat protein [Alphaproteobacteria bacterium]
MVGIRLGAIVLAALSFSGAAEACAFTERPGPIVQAPTPATIAAAQSGEPPAMVALGLAYREGLGVPRDLTRAYQWFNLASRSESRARALRDEVMRCIGPEELLQAQVEALRLIEGPKIRTAAGR